MGSALESARQVTNIGRAANLRERQAIPAFLQLNLGADGCDFTAIEVLGLVYFVGSCIETYVATVPGMVEGLS